MSQRFLHMNPHGECLKKNYQDITSRFFADIKHESRGLPWKRNLLYC